MLTKTIGIRHHRRQGARGTQRTTVSVQDWPGYHYFFCDGRLMLPKPWKGCLGTAALIIALEGLFVGLVAIKLDAPLRYIAILSGYDSI